MSWQVGFAPDVERDVAEAAAWYVTHQGGLGAKFIREITQVWDGLAESPLVGARRHPAKNIRWRYPERFPYRVIYEINEDEQTVRVAPVLHASRHDRHWQRRI